MSHETKLNSMATSTMEFRFSMKHAFRAMGSLAIKGVTGWLIGKVMDQLWTGLIHSERRFCGIFQYQRSGQSPVLWTVSKGSPARREPGLSLESVSED